MNLINRIKKHRELRKNQEILVDKLCIFSQKRYFDKIKGEFSLLHNDIQDCILHDLEDVSKQVHEIETKLPWLYFFLSDLFGFSRSLYKKHIPYNPND